MGDRRRADKPDKPSQPSVSSGLVKEDNIKTLYNPLTKHAIPHEGALTGRPIYLLYILYMAVISVLEREMNRWSAAERDYSSKRREGVQPSATTRMLCCEFGNGINGISNVTTDCKYTRLSSLSTHLLCDVTIRYNDKRRPMRRLFYWKNCLTK